MLIENPEALKTWLAAVLEPLCDAEPTALAKYVYALVKKDKPLDDLRDAILDQLYVFLQSETEVFVELLFKTLETKDYLKPQNIEQNVDSNARSTSPTIAETSSRAVSEPQEQAKVTNISREEKNESLAIRSSAKKDTKNEAEKETDNRVKNDNGKKDGGNQQRIILNRTTKFTPATVPKEKPAYATEQTLVKVIPDILKDSLNEQSHARNSKRDRKSDSDKEERRRRQYKSRSRSRSWDRARRSGAAVRPLWRNRSPPYQANRYERRRSRSGSPPVRAPRYRNRSPPQCSDSDVPVNRSRSRSRERVPSPVTNPPRERASRERDRQSRNRDRVDREKVVDRDRERDVERERTGRGRDCVSGTATPTQDSNPGESGNQQRGTTTLAGIFTSQKKRCRDFHEKGYCMRGDLCQFDHGTDPVVLEDVIPHSMSFSMNRLPLNRHPSSGCISEYNPLAPDIWTRNATGQYTSPPPPYYPFVNPPPHGHHPVQRELIPVPIARADMQPNANPNAAAPNSNQRINSQGGVPLYPTAANNNHASLPAHQIKKKSFDFNRLGPNRHMSKAAGGNCSLELKKIPRGMNDITHLNNHFSKFGKIVNIQVNYEDDPEAALITFFSHMEANVAYKSTEAVLNNRFIKVFWHNSEQSKQENVPPTTRIPAKERLTTNHNHVSHNKVLINKENVKINHNAQTLPASAKEDPASIADSKKNGEEPTAASKDQTAVISSSSDLNIKPDKQPSAELAAMVRKRGEGAAKLARDLNRRSQQLLEKQLQHQKMLIKRLESGGCNDIQKESLLDTIKSVQKNIEKMKKELVSNQNKNIPQPEEVYMVNSMRKISLSSANNAKTPMVKKSAFGVLKKIPRSKEETQKEILDAELDLFTKQQEGQDVSELQKHVADLKRQQLVLKTSTPVRRGFINRVSPRGRFSKAATVAKFVNQTVDNRPRSFLVSGYEMDELDQLVQHFTQFGEIVDNVADTKTPSLWLQFKTRKIAEQAATKGRQFIDRTLTVTWQSKSTQSQPSASDKLQSIDSSNPAFLKTPWDSTNNSAALALPEKTTDIEEMVSEEYGPRSPVYTREDWDPNLVENIPPYDSEDDEGKDKEEERSWRR